MIRKNILFICCIFILIFCFVFIIINWSFKSLLRSFDSFWLSLTDKVTTGTNNCVPFMVKIILLELASLSAPAADKTQYFAYLSFNSTLHLSMAFRLISKNYLNILMAQQLLHFLKFHSLHQLQFSLKLLLLTVSILKLVASSFEQNHKLLVSE